MARSRTCVDEELRWDARARPECTPDLYALDVSVGPAIHVCEFRRAQVADGFYAQCQFLRLFSHKAIICKSSASNVAHVSMLNN